MSKKRGNDNVKILKAQKISLSKFIFLILALTCYKKRILYVINFLMLK